MPVLRPPSSVFHPHWVAIPNFVDTDVFRPVKRLDEKRECRKGLGIPEDPFVVGTAAAVKKDHKRIDYLIREFAMFLDGDLSQSRPAGGGTGSADPARGECRDEVASHQPYLLIAGARQADTDELVAVAGQLCGDRVKFLLDVPRERMPDFYRTVDVFALTSLFEMMPIAVLEALASGLPVVANNHPVLRWMIGADAGANPYQPSTINRQPSRPGGATIDMSADGDLAEFLSGLTPEWVAEHGAAARKRAESVYATDVVIGEYIDYYKHVVSDREGEVSRKGAEIAEGID